MNGRIKWVQDVMFVAESGSGHGTVPITRLTGWFGRVQVIAEEIGLGGSPSPTVRAYMTWHAE